MKAVVQFVSRQSVIVALLCLTFAFLQGVQICEGLWQGTGLHGYFMQRGLKGGPPQLVSVWDSFVNMLTALGLVLLLCLAAVWRGSATQRLGKAGVVENPGSENILRTRRRQRRRR